MSLICAALVCVAAIGEEPKEKTESQIAAAVDHDLKLLVETLTKADRKLPDLIPRHQLAPLEGDSELRKLMIARYNTAAVECAASLALFPNAPASNVVSTARCLRDAEWEMSSEAARIAVQTKYCERIKLYGHTR